MKQTLTFLFASTLILSMASYRQADVPPVTRDTVPRVQYQYIYKFQSPAKQIDAAYDTIRRFVLPVIGNRMFKDESEYYQNLLINQLNTVFRGLVVDSIKISKP